jgi:hypothetical protein
MQVMKPTFESDRVMLIFAGQELTWFGELAKTGFGAVESWPQAQSNYAERQVVLQRDLAAARGQPRRAAEPDGAGGGHCCPGAGALTGTVASRTVQAVDLVQPGQTLVLGGTRRKLCHSEFQGNPIDAIRVGQPITISVDDADKYPHLSDLGMPVEATVTVHTPPR